MAGETTLTLVGTAVAAPELRFTQSGVAVCSFTVASNERRLNASTGKWEDGEALFLRVNAWRQLAENAAESVDKGVRVIITGRLRQRSYDTSAGEKRTVVELEADEIGLSMKFKAVSVAKVERQAEQTAPADDPWGSTPPRQSASLQDEAPF